MHYLMRGQWQKALRRWNGYTVATFGDLKLPVYYPGLRQIRRHFAPHFTLRSCIGVGVAVPPSYCEKWAHQHRGAFRMLCRLEEILSPLPIVRLTGDHILLCFKKVLQMTSTQMTTAAITTVPTLSNDHAGHSIRTSVLAMQ